MTQHQEPRTVAGERRADLLQALSYLTVSDSSDGTATVNGHIPNDVAVPLWRAVVRVEAELLARDADLLTADITEVRTAAQRRADAFVLLAQRVKARPSPAG
jgi:hypothetical protein